MGPVHPPSRASRLDGVAFSFDESMSGEIRIDEIGARAGNLTAQDSIKPIRLDVHIRTENLGRFLRDPQRRADMAGTVSVPSLGGTFQIRDGQLELFSVDARTGLRQLVHSFRFTAADGHAYFFRGYKNLRHQPWRFDLLRHLTHLSFTVYRGHDQNMPVYGSGLLRFGLADAPAWVASMRCEGTRSNSQNLAARAAFLSLLWGTLRNEYLKGIRLFYETQYENLVLTGVHTDQHANAGVRFLVVSGVHDKGFPWGDDELFSDVLLAVADGNRGYRRYCITARVLPELALDLVAGRFEYRGPIFAIGGGVSSSWSEMNSSDRDAATLSAEIEVQFESQAEDIVSFPFPRSHPVIRRLCSWLIGWLWSALPGTNPPGIHIRPHSVAVRFGSILILRTNDGTILEDLRLDAEGTAGECERGTFRSIKRPRLRYRYRCAVHPSRKTARVEIIAGALFADRPRRKLLDRLLCGIGSAEIGREAGAGVQVTRIKPRREESSSSPRKTVLEVNNDQYPAAVFQRRIVEVEDSGERLLALEEDSHLSA